MANLTGLKTAAFDSIELNGQDLETRISNASFTITPAGTGVATFEFRQLQPKASPTPPQIPPVAPSASISGGDRRDERKHLIWRSFLHGSMRVSCSLVAIIALTLLGNVVFSALEADAETASRRKCALHNACTTIAFAPTPL